METYPTLPAFRTAADTALVNMFFFSLVNVKLLTLPPTLPKSGKQKPDHT